MSDREGLARVEAKANDGGPVLFLCVHNAGRSQMALGWFNHLSDGKATAWSGGSEPPRRSPVRRARHGEAGIDIAQEFPKPWTDEIVRAADVVVTMGCGDACLFPASATRTGTSTTPPARTSKRYDPSATPSKLGLGTSWCRSMSTPSDPESHERSATSVIHRRGCRQVGVPQREAMPSRGPSSYQSGQGHRQAEGVAVATTSARGQALAG